MIKFENITKIYELRSGQNPVVALQDVSFEVKEKEFVSIVGKSGVGKTTLFKLLLVQERPTQGKIFFMNQDVHQIRAKDLFNLRRRIGVVFQNYELFNKKTSYENIAYPMETIGANKDQIKRDVNEILQLVGLTDRAFNFPEELSEGEKQRVAIARALIHRPDVIVADEPTGNLDPANTYGIIKLLYKINEFGTTVILSTHDKGVVNNLEKRVITFEDGKIIRDEERGKFIL